MRVILSPGARLPGTEVAEIQSDRLVVSYLDVLFAHKRVILIGVPGAFTPICSRIHVAGFVDKARKLLASGFDMIACIAVNDPWVLAKWQEAVDPDRQIRFLSDGNMDFANTCCLTIAGHANFVGTRLARFTAIVNDNVVERIAIEAGMEVTCSGADQI